MLYVDGMNAVMNQNEVVQWLYSLVESSVSRPASSLFEANCMTDAVSSSVLVSTRGENKFKTTDRFR